MGNTTSHLKTLQYILAHNPRNNGVCKTIMQNLPMLTRDPNMKIILKTHKFIEIQK